METAIENIYQGFLFGVRLADHLAGRTILSTETHADFQATLKGIAGGDDTIVPSDAELVKAGIPKMLADMMGPRLDQQRMQQAVAVIAFHAYAAACVKASKARDAREGGGEGSGDGGAVQSEAVGE